MRALAGWPGRIVACCLSAVLAVPYSVAATRDLPSAPQPANHTMTTTTEANTPRLMPADMTIAENSSPVAEVGQQTPNDNHSQSSTSTGQTPATERPTAPHPVGTAAAPAVNAGGVAGSRPAGAAIAPAKQRRVRRLAIRIGLLVGAAVAVGTVTALSMGSPSRPN